VIGDAIGEAVTDCGRAWAAVPERDPKILAAEVFDLFTTDEYGARSEVITARHGELDSAVRHKLPLLCVISLNGGWTAKPERNKPGRDLGYTRYDKMAEAFGCYAEYVEDAEGIRPGCSAPGPKSKRAWWSFSTLRPITAPARHDRAFYAPRDLSGLGHLTKGASARPFALIWAGTLV